MAKLKKGLQFDDLTRALAKGTTRRQALKGFLGTALGVALVGQSGLAEAARPTTSPGRADIARESAKLLARLPSEDKLQKAKIPAELRAAIEADRKLLKLGARAQSWKNSDLQDYQAQVNASVAQHQALSTSMVSTEQVTAQQVQICFGICTGQFLAATQGCPTDFLGALLCQVIALVVFDLCALGCILNDLFS